MSTSIFKLNFEGISKTIEAPANLPDLLDKIEQIFQNELPAFWSLHYKDVEGDSIMLITPEDFQVLIHDVYPPEGVIIYITEAKRECVILNRSKSKKDSQTNDEQGSEGFNLIEEGQLLETKAQSNNDFDEILSLENRKDKQKEETDYQNRLYEANLSPLLKIVGLPLPIQRKILDFVPIEKTSMIEQSSQTEDKRHLNQIPLMETSSQTTNHRELTEDKLVQTTNNSLITEDKGLQIGSNLCTFEKPENIDYSSSPHLVVEELNLDPDYILLKSYVSEKADSSVQIQDNFNVDDEIIIQNKEEKKLEDDEAEDLRDIAEKNELERREKEQTKDSKATEKAIHSHCVCDGCGVSPILGVRYRCSICEDFDYCEVCESKNDHQHIFLKLNSTKDYAKLPGSQRAYLLDPDYEETSSLQTIKEKIEAFITTLFNKIVRPDAEN